MKYDAVIIGGGPAGLCTAVNLLSHGVSCCIIDKAVFPREKICAGVLTIKTREKINSIFRGFPWEDLKCSTISKLKIQFRNTSIGTYNLKYPYVIVNRAQFDYELMKYFLRMNGKLMENERSYKINISDNNIILSDGTIIQYDFLVGADGINSRIRKFIDPLYKPKALCIQAFTEPDSCPEYVSADFGYIHSGYCWNIPRGNKLGIGVAGSIKELNNIKKTFTTQAAIYEIGKKDIRSWPLSCGNYVRKPINKNIILVGDAAGLVDPVTGEGIYYAIESGILAADSIVSFYNKGYMNYHSTVKLIHKRINQQKRFRFLLYSGFFRKSTLFIVKKKTHWAEFIFDEVISAYNNTYSEALIKLIESLVRK